MNFKLINTINILNKYTPSASVMHNPFEGGADEA